MIFDKQYRDIRRTRKIINILKLPDQGRILDVSCGDGHLLKSIQDKNSQLELFGVDALPSFLTIQTKLSNIKFQTADATRLPYPDNSFDVTLCALSLHHYLNLSVVLSEITRVTKADGEIYLIDIFPKNLWSQYLYNLVGCSEPYHFGKYYTTNELSQLTNTLKLKINQTFLISTFPRILTLELNTLIRPVSHL